MARRGKKPIIQKKKVGKAIKTPMMSHDEMPAPAVKGKPPLKRKVRAAMGKGLAASAPSVAPY